MLLLLPGFGETRAIFAQLAPHLPGELVFIENFDLIGNSPRPGITALEYAEQLIARHGITAADVVIGHSMGGWVALAIKQRTGCRAVQIASWSDPRKVTRPVFKNPRLIYWSVRAGLYLSPLTKRALAWLHYRGKPSRPMFIEVFENLQRSSREYVINQLRVIFNPPGEAITAVPDLRVHARGDRLILFPDQPTLETPGDHFNLWTHPREVAEAILREIRNWKLENRN